MCWSWFNPPMAMMDSNNVQFRDMDAQKELHELRESTRAALMKSWAEVEALQGEKDGLEERLFEMEVELNQSLEREAEWKRLYEELKNNSDTNMPSRATPFSAAATGAPAPPALAGSVSQGGLGAFLNKGKGPGPTPLLSSQSVGGDRSLGNFLNKPRGLRTQADRGDWTSDDEMDDPTIYSESYVNNPNKQRWGWRGKKQKETELQLQKQISDYEKEKQELMAQWQVKLECRDTAIHSMEQTTQLQGKTLDELRNELKECRRALTENDEQANQEVERLNRKLDEKRKYVLKQQDKIQDYKEHIKDLTDQLEKLCRSKEQSSRVSSRASVGDYDSNNSRASDDRSNNNTDRSERSRSASAARSTTTGGSKRGGGTYRDKRPSGTGATSTARGNISAPRTSDRASRERSESARRRSNGVNERDRSQTRESSTRSGRTGETSIRSGRRREAEY